MDVPWLGCPTALAAIADDGDQFERDCFLIGPDGFRRFRLTRKAEWPNPVLLWIGPVVLTTKNGVVVKLVLDT